MPLIEDRIRALEARAALPPGQVVGSKVGWMGVDSEGFDVFQLIPDADAQILDGHGDPNGNLVAEKGMLYVDRDEPALWQNSDGNDTWTVANNGFPIGPEDDGTATYSVTGTGSVTTTKALLDSDNSYAQTEHIVTGVGTSTVIEAVDTAGSSTSGFTVNAYAAGGADAILTMNANAVAFYVRSGNPNGSLAGNKGDVCFDIATPQIWVNSTGSTVWITS